MIVSPARKIRYRYHKKSHRRFSVETYRNNIMRKTKIQEFSVIESNPSVKGGVGIAHHTL